MNLELLDEHTIDVDRLTGGLALDVGCRNFRFSHALVDRGCKVIGVDPAPDVWADYVGPVIGIQGALEHAGPDRVKLVYLDNGNGSHVVEPSRHGTGIFESPVVRLPWIMEAYQAKHFDVVKLDAEGAEYDLLLNWPGPIATQLTVEFHDFAPRCPPDVEAVHVAIRKHLAQWYDVVRDEKTKQWGWTNYWDSLFVLKENLGG